MADNAELWSTLSPQLKGLRAVGDGGNFEAECPLGSHKNGKPFSAHAEKGVWRCFNGHGAGTLRQLAQRLGCATDAPRVDWGLDAAMRKYGVTVTEHAAVFPVLDDEGNRCRAHARRHKGEPRFQYWGKGRTYHALVAWDLVKEWGMGSGLAYIVEGNRDWLTLAAHDWPAIGILGTEHFDSARQDAFGALKAVGIGAVVLSPDNDEPGWRAARHWVSVLESDGFAVGVRALPENVNGQLVKDMFDLYRATGGDFNQWLHELPVVWRGN